MKKHINWLKSELELWVREGIIDDAQAGAIRDRYPSEEQAGTWGRVAFAAFGAVLIGLGVILLFAYNWDRMHKFAKLGVVFFALLAAHGSALFVRRPATRETLHVLGTMFFGAGIWLVAQVYHINEHYPNAFLVWGLGALSLAWVLPSLPQAFMAVILLVLWNGFEAFGFRNPNYVAPALILFGILPLVVVLKSRVLASAGLAAFLFALFTMLQHVGWSLVMPIFFSTAATLLAAGLVLQRSGKAPELAWPCLQFGNSLSLLLLYFLTFRGAREALAYLNREQSPTIWFSVSLAIALGLWAAALRPFQDIRERIRQDLRPDYLIVPLALLVYALQFFGVLKLQGILATAPYNLLFLAASIMLMQHGFRALRLRSAVIGSVLFAALAMARYTDLFHSLLARALVFLLAGGLMIGVGIFFARARKAGKEDAR